MLLLLFFGMMKKQSRRSRFEEKQSEAATRVMQRSWVCQ